MNNKIPEEALDLITKTRLGYMVPCQADGVRCLSHRGALKLMDDRHLIFAYIVSLPTVEMLKRCPDVVVEVVDPSSKAGYRFKGKATCGVNHFMLIRVESSEPSYLTTLAVAKEKSHKPWASLLNNRWKFYSRK